MPTHTVVFELEVQIGERTLRAVSKPRGAARNDYEDAIDSGKTTALHEVAGYVRSGSEVDLWQFDTVVEQVGRANNSNTLTSTIAQLGEPRAALRLARQSSVSPARADERIFCLSQMD